jgi:hypothetical protein
MKRKKHYVDDCSFFLFFFIFFSPFHSFHIYIYIIAAYGGDETVFSAAQLPAAPQVCEVRHQPHSMLAEHCVHVEKLPQSRKSSSAQNWNQREKKNITSNHDIDRQTLLIHQDDDFVNN